MARTPAFPLSSQDAHVVPALAVLAATSLAPRRPRRRERALPARLLRAMVEQGPDALVLTDAAGRIQLVNTQTEALFGYPREELLGQPVERLVPVRFQAVHQQHRATYAKDPHRRPMGANLLLAGRRRDGSEFPVEVSLAPFEDEAESLVIVSIRDISELQRVHAAQRDAERANEDLRRLLAVTDTALAHLELDNLLPKLLSRVRDAMAVDNAVIMLLDAASGELHVRAALGLEEEVAADVRVPMGQGFAGRIAASRAPLIVDDLSSFPVVNPFLREQLRSAVGVPLLRHDRVLGVLHVGTVEPHRFTAQDVQLLERVAERVAVAIERAQLFERVQASEARLRRLVEAGIIGIAVGEDGTVQEANDAFLRLVGYTRADLLAGRIPLLRRPAEELAVYGEADARARQELLTLGTVTPYEREVLRPDGSRVTVLLGGSLLRREPVEWVVYALDVSERKWLEQQREDARASELAVREVNQHLDEFFRTASHDLRQPIAVTKGQAEMALRRFTQLAARLPVQEGKQAEQTAEVLAMLRQTNQSIDRVSQLAAQLFDIARARAGTLDLRLGRLDVAALVQEQVAAQRSATPTRTIQVEAPHDGQAVWVDGDGERLRQALTNYLTNALKYSAADQPVTVRLEVAEQLAVVSVTDQGPGLPWKEQSRVWEMGHRAPGVEVQSGTEGSMGMGLYIVKRLIELHPGGRVGVESVVGEGSTFWFRLPLVHAPAVGPDQADS